MSDTSASYFNTDTSPSFVRGMRTNDGFDLVAVLLDQLQRQKADGHHSAVLDYLATVDLCERALAQEVALGVLVFSVLEVLHNKYSLYRGEY